MKTFWNKEKSILLIKVIVAAALPWLLCGVYLLASSHKFSDVSLLASEWDDELFYFKQVAGVVKEGIPAGFFGYNESHAALLSFGAWSPVILMYWVAWGKVFGWTLSAPFLANAASFSIALAIFVWQVRPDWRKFLLIVAGVAMFPLNIRYIFCCMPEMTIWAFLLIFYALAFGYSRDNGKIRLVFMYVIAVYLTLMRPYFALTFLLPMILVLRNTGKKAVTVCFNLIGMGLSVGCFFVLTGKFSAPYFADIISSELGNTIETEGVIAGIIGLFRTIFSTVYDLYYRILKSFKVYSTVGAYFLTYIVVCALFFIRCTTGFIYYRKNPSAKDGKTLISTHCFLMMAAVFFAIVGLYELTDGSKHLLGFISVGIIVLAALEEGAFVRTVLLGAFCVFFFFTKMKYVPYECAIPFKNEYVDAREGYWSKTFEAAMMIDRQELPSYNNTVLWTLFDPGIVSGEYPAVEAKAGDLFPNKTDWQMLYLIPDGFGISCCEGDYVEREFDKLKCPFLAVVEGGRIDEMCSQSDDWTEIGREGTLVVFQKTGAR